MRAQLTVGLILGATLLAAAPAWAVPRADAIWARTTAGQPITLDGVLDEPAWAKAESVTVRYGIENGIPGSGWKEEGGHLAQDSTFAVLKLLVVGNQLYLGATMKDASIGGSVTFNRFDGLLMALKDHLVGTYPAPPAEYFYSWWYPDDTTLSTQEGLDPCFRGVSPPGPDRATIPCSSPRTATEIANWDARTRVHGISNSDAVNDTGYTIEMRFDLGAMGYDVTQPSGDIIEWNCSVYDTDWYWPINLSRFSVNRSWIESPWGNAMWYDELHVYSRPDVTINSGPTPALPVDWVVPTTAAAPPKIDGKLDDAVWATVPGFDIRYGDQTLRNSYGGVGKWRSGQFQPTVNGGTAAVVDPADATIKMVTIQDTLYIGFDVRDQVVQYSNNVDRWDGAIITITDRQKRWDDHNLYTWRASFQVGPTGNFLAQDKMPYLRDTVLCARGGLQLNPGTTVDTAGTQADNGYTAEVAFDLTKMGYSHGLDDRLLYIGIDLLDGDSFTPFTDSYGTRTWWFRQYENECCPAVAYMDPTHTTLAVNPPALPLDFAALGATPNPFRLNTRIRYALPRSASVTLETYDVLGRLVSRQALGVQPPGEHDAVLGRQGLSTSVYLYRLRFADPASGAILASRAGKVMFLR
jgi:hypothetical protein